MARKEINLEKLVLDNNTNEDVLYNCVLMLEPKMTEEVLGEKYAYWKILVALNEKLNGQKRAKIL